MWRLALDNLMPAVIFTIDDRSVVERVRNNSILFSQKRLEDRLVSVETRRKQNSVLSLIERRELVLESLVIVSRSTDEPH